MITIHCPLTPFGDCSALIILSRWVVPLGVEGKERLLLFCAICYAYNLVKPHPIKNKSITFAP